MEGQIVEQAQIVTMNIATVITIASTIVMALAGAIALLFRILEKKNEAIIQLTKSFVESTKDHAKAVENNTKVIERLPDSIMLHIKSVLKK